MKLVIIGGVAAGASAAARARRLSEEAQITIVERGEAPSFANCGLPYYIGGVIDKRDKLLVTTQERLHDRYRLDVRTRTEATAIDRVAKTVRIRNLATGEESSLPYDKLILAPGATPLRPPLPGIDRPGVFTLRDLADADRLHAAIVGASRAVVVGGGFIGVEMAENFLHRGLDVTLAELNQQILPPWDAEMVAPFAANLQKHGLKIRLGDSAEAIEPGTEAKLAVKLKSGAVVPADLVVMAIGVRPENKLATLAGLDVGPRGGIRVNEFMQTSDPDIYAAGDAVETKNALTGEPTQIPLGGPANRQGRIAADHIFGRTTRYRGTQGTAIVGAFGMAAAMTGASEKALRAAGTPYHKAYVHPAHHAGYFPGAEGMSLKLLFAPGDGKLLGAQAVGGAGVDKRIDVLAVAMQAGMTVYDLEEMELAYAPQFGSAKDPINMIGFVAAGILRGEHPVTYADDLADPSRPFLLDVRDASEYAAGHIPGAVNVPVDQLRGRLDELPRDRPIAAYCKVGQRGYLATRILVQEGFDVRNLSGGFTTYEAVGGKL